MSAADKLEGLVLADGWRITRHLERNPNGSGGTFSQSYLAEKDGRAGFVKAFDFWEAFEQGRDTVKAIQVLTAAYDHERDILRHCGERRLSHVVLAIDHGEVQVPDMGTMEGRVFYLIFEVADGDVRCQLDTSTRCDVLWCMRALKDVSLGLWQVHREMIAHQDTKPSNILVYDNVGFRIADFGRASRRGHPVWHDDVNVAGDRSYAPPELLYGYTHPEFGPRRFGCDLYMLGNLAAFLFSGRNVTAHLFSRLASEHHPKDWGGTYEDVLPYMNAAFTRVLEDIGPNVDQLVRAEVIGIIRELCAPDLAHRGHPKGLGRQSQYSLERYVSRLDRITKRLEVTLRAQARAA